MTLQTRWNLLLVPALMAAPVAVSADDFVSAVERHFVRDGRAFYVQGANAYGLAFEPPEVVDALLADAQAMGLTVLRLWGFCDGGEEAGACFQPQPRVYDEASFQKLDAVIAKAGTAGFHLIIPLVNNWDDFGGMNQYVAWCEAPGGHDAFYTNACTRTLYQDYVRYVLTRVNTVTGVAYREDPTIMIWELANEPRAESDPAGRRLTRWVDDMAAFVKSVDPNHLVSSGEEGWYAVQGADFLANSRLSGIDVVSFHLYPEAYGLDDAQALAWIDRRVADAHQTVGKPVYLGEFGSPVARRLLGTFARGVERWQVDWGFTPASPERVETPSADGNGAIRYTFPNPLAPFNEAAGERRFADPGVDLRAYETVTAWVFIPDGSPLDVKAELYAKAGPDWTWRNGERVTLAVGAWTPVTLPVSEAFAPEQVRSVGVKVVNGSRSFSGPVFLDGVVVSSADVEARMADRNRRYGEWYGRLDALDADGALVWRLSGHELDGTVTPDTDGFAVYHPEDAGTVTVINGFAQAVARKNAEAPAAFIRSDANRDGVADIADAVAMLLFLFHGRPGTSAEAVDANDDSARNVADAIYLLSYLFREGPPPPPPFPEPGFDPTP